MSGERPLDHLHRLAGERATGEFICVTPSFEAHVFLQGGRIAWATDSKHPFSFASHLQETAKIETETFRQVVEECRRERLPLGETLVAWGLASWDTVRSSLAQQIGRAVSLMASLSAAQTVFLQRSYASYNELLTFAVNEFAAEGERASGPPGTGPTPSQPAGAQPGLAEQLHGSIDGLAWVEILQGERIIDAYPSDGSPRAPIDLFPNTLCDGADFVAIRSTRGSVIGLGLSGRNRSLWCRLDGDSTFGAVVTSLWSVTAAARQSVQMGPPRGKVLTWVGAESTTIVDEVRAFMDRAHEVLAVLVLPQDPSLDPIVACGSATLAMEECATVARRRAVALRRWRVPEPDLAGERLSSIGFYLKTMVCGEARLWCFGAELYPEHGSTLWLFADRRTSQGLGWAYLSALTRVLSRLEESAGQ